MHTIILKVDWSSCVTLITGNSEILIKIGLASQSWVVVSALKHLCRSWAWLRFLVLPDYNDWILISVQ